MTTLDLPPVRRRPKSLTRDPEALLDLAVRLHGRPVPGIRMTEEQFVDWCPEELVRAEWDNGEVILMTTGSGEHVDICLWVARLLIEFVEHHELGMVRAPFAVRLGEMGKRRDPDVIFVANDRLHLVKKNHLEGPPDLAVEVVSPDSKDRDWGTKREEFAEAGVREYWVIDPLSLTFAMYSLVRKKYRATRPDSDGRFHSKVLGGLFVRKAWFFTSPLPRLSKVLKELGLRM